MSHAKIIWLIVPVLTAILSIIFLMLKKHTWNCIASSICGFLVVLTNVITFCGLLFVASDVYVNPMIVGV